MLADRGTTMRAASLLLTVLLAGAAKAAEQVSESKTVKLPEVSIPLIVTEVPLASGEVIVKYEPSEKAYTEQRDRAAAFRQSLPTATARKTVTVTRSLLGVERSRTFVLTPSQEAAKAGKSVAFPTKESTRSK